MQPARILVLDFDGTVCRGDAPVIAYGDQLDVQAQTLGSAPDIAAGVSAFLADEVPTTDPALHDAADGYAAAEVLARRAGLDTAAIAAAYASSRRMLAAGNLETATPDGLGDLLAALPNDTLRVLVTNAPLEGVEDQLRKLGIAHGIDRVITDANKPTGMHPILADLLTSNQLQDQPAQLLSIGDIWINDLEPAQALGCATAFIDRHDHGIGSPSARATTFEGLYDFVRAWAQASVLTGEAATA